QSVEPGERRSARRVQPEHDDGVAARIVGAREHEHAALMLAGNRRRGSKDTRCHENANAMKSVQYGRIHRSLSLMWGGWREGFAIRRVCRRRFAAACPEVTAGRNFGSDRGK